MRGAAALLALFAVAQVSALSVNFDDQAWKTRPITKVINLLSDMQVQLEKEQKADEELYDQFACWCETNDKLKTRAIADAEVHLTDLATNIEELTAKSAELGTDIETLKAEIAENEKGLNSATAIRSNENAEFVTDEQDSMQMVGGLSGAVKVLGKHHAQPHASAAEAEQAFVQLRSMRGTDKQPVAASSYDSQSGQIFGVLETMKEEFSKNLANDQKSEADSASSFSEMKKTKKQELAAAKQQLSEKQQELADTDENNANSKTDQTDTAAQLENDQVFLKDLKERCATMDDDWDARKATRLEEMQAVSEAMAILNDDDARDLAHKTTGSAFVQVATASSKKSKQALVRTQVVAFLNSRAAALHKPTLANLAIMLQSGDVFLTLKNLITKMVGDRKAEQAEEVKIKDSCTANLTANEVKVTAEYEVKDDLDGKKEDLENLIATVTKHLDEAKAEKAAQELALQTAAVNRGKENLAFQKERLDQRSTQEILAKALERLQKFYSRGKDKDAEELAQVDMRTRRDSAAKQAPPPTFKPYKKAGGAGGVVGILQNVIAESVAVEKELMAAEQEAQTAYGEFSSTSNKVLKALGESISTGEGEKAKADGEFVETKETLMTSMKNIVNLGEVQTGLHRNCDYILHNFDARQGARVAEIEGMDQALAMLNGADFN